MAEGKPEAYEGDRPYIFVDYAHADRDAVLPIIRALVDEGYRVWYDDGIELAEDYPEYIANHVLRCASFVMFVSRSSLASAWCRAEVNYALDLKKERILPIYLEDVEITPGLQMRMGRRQAIKWYECDSDEAFYGKLFKARWIEACLTDEGRRRRGVKPRGEKPTAEGLAEADVEGVASPEASRKVVGAEDAKHGATVPGTEGPEGSEAIGDEGAEAGAVSPESAEPEAVEPKPDKPKVAGPQAGDSKAVIPEDVKTKAAEPKPEQPEARRAGISGQVDVNPDAAKDEAARRKVDKPKVAGDRTEEIPKVVRPQAGSQGAVPTGCAAGVAPSLDGGPEPKGRPARHLHDGRGAGVAVAGAKPRGSLAAYPWADLKELSRMIAAAGSDVTGLAIARAYHLVDRDGRLRGDEKPLQLKDGTRTSVRILGFRHDELAGGGKSGISFEFADVPATHRMNPEWTNEGGWEGSEMRGWLNGYFLGQLPDDLRTSVALARKRTNNRGKVARNDARSVTATDDRLWLLSSNEVYGGLPGVYGREGAQYRLYADKGVSTENYGFCRKKKDGANSRWWLRSPYAVVSDWFRGVVSDGDCLANLADLDWGVSPGFCL